MILSQNPPNVFKTPSFPKELSPRYSPRPFRAMELLKGRYPVKTVSLIETVLIKNRVVRYTINHIYTLLFDGEERKRGNKEVMVPFSSSINGKGWGVHHGI